MPYAATHKANTRKRIVESARKLFNRNGFDAVTIDEIMEDAGLTRGGFYKHFAAKDDLYRAAVLQFARAERPEPWQTRHIAQGAEGVPLARMIVNSYLSRDHFDDRDGSCPMVALPSDVARAADGVKDAFREVLDMMLRCFEANLSATDVSSRDRALAVAATIVGGMVLARAIDDPALADELRAAALSEVMASTGWSDGSVTPPAAAALRAGLPA
jgi:TetR/AcrR family transcriptional repressor of nem operon